MKLKALLAAALLALSLSLSGCTLFSGTEGDAYIAYSWSVGPITFYTEDPSFGDTIYNGYYEDATVGSWYFEYTAWDGSGWYGVYTIYVNDGGFLIDGEDIYFELACYSSGPSFYEWSPEWAYRSLEPADPAEDELSRLEAAGGTFDEVTSVSSSGNALFDHDDSYDHTETITQGGYTIVLEYSRLDQ